MRKLLRLTYSILPLFIWLTLICLAFYLGIERGRVSARTEVEESVAMLKGRIRTLEVQHSFVTDLWLKSWREPRCM